MISTTRLLAAATAIFLLIPNVHGQGLRTPRALPPEIVPPAVVVTGLDGKAISLTAADIAKLPQQTVKATSHGAPVVFQGVLLSDVLAKAETPSGEKYRKTVASCMVVMQGSDGYRAILSWAEVDPSFTDRKIYLVTAQDGKPLAENDGPFMTIVPDDKRPTRWVRQVTRLTVRHAPVE